MQPDIRLFSHFGGLFHGHLVEREHGLALSGTGPGSCWPPPASRRIRGRGVPGALPGGEIAVGVVGAAVEDASLAGLALDDIAAILRAGHADLFQPGFGVAAVGEAAAADELAVAPIADDQLLPHSGQARPIGSGPSLQSRASLLCAFATCSAKGP